MSASSLAELLASQLPQGVAARAQALLRLQAVLDRVLPAALAGHVRVQTLEGGVLSLACDCGAVAGRLRHQTGPLLETLEKQGIAARGVRVNVDPHLGARYTPPAEKAGVPPAALESLAHLNAEIEDGPLKDALNQLLRHHRGR